MCARGWVRVGRGFHRSVDTDHIIIHYNSDNCWSKKCKTTTKNDFLWNSPWSMIVATGRVRDEKYDAELSIGGHLDQLTMNYDTWQLDTDCWQPMQAQIPTDQWVKIAWQFDGMNHTASFWINDVLQKSLSVDKRSQKCMGSASLHLEGSFVD